MIDSVGRVSVGKLYQPDFFISELST